MTAGCPASRFDDKALAATFNHYRSTVALRDTALDVGRSRPGRLLHRRPLRRRRDPPGRLPGCHPHGGVVPGRRGVRLAAFPQRPVVHEFHRPHVLGELDGVERAARGDHPGRQQPHPRPAVRGGLVLPAPPGVGSDHRATPRRGPPRHHRPILDAPRTGCADASRSWRPARTSSRSWPPPSPGSSPVSCGPK